MYKVYDRYNNFLFKSNRVLFAELFILLCKKPCLLKNNNNNFNSYFLGNEIDEIKIKDKLIQLFIKHIIYFSSDSYYTKNDFPNDLCELINYILEEINYWISCCYESGHTLNVELNDSNYHNIVINKIRNIQIIKNNLNHIKSAL